MFTMLTGNIKHYDNILAERIYRFRHEFFVEQLGWEACRKPDGRERDQFDGPGCVHVVGQDGAEIVSYGRLLPTTRPHLLTDVYPEILRGAEAPTGPAIFEWTRHGVAPRMREAKGSGVFARAAFGVVACAAEVLNLQGLLVETHPVSVDRLMDMGWDIEPLALPSEYEGALLLPIFARLTARTIATGQAALAAVGGARLHVREDLRLGSPDTQTTNAIH
jgi:acyl-homoserine lactone synthase